MRSIGDDGDASDGADFASLVKLAREGDQTAKESLVERLQRLVWHTIAEFGLTREDRQDVFAAAFCRLFERLDTIRQPERLPGWIATTARNEAHTLLRARGRLVATEEIDDGDSNQPLADERLLDAELRVALRAGFGSLPHGCRQLLRLLSADPCPSYDEISSLLDMPHGSIGPTRRRCLERLRNTPPMRPFTEGGQP
ncbi:MAG TPA: sigma-70 family RNA polymerase sigma factor [Acidimicrobiales bacterium]|nr:sigma-70 family RNA polymerase sigma factor [Acidimicrobiales bacterium]